MDAVIDLFDLDTYGKSDQEIRKVKLYKNLARNAFLGIGCVFLLFLCMVPIWNSLSLLMDANYVFWAGRRIPMQILSMCAVIIVLYVLTILGFFAYSPSSVQDENTVTLLGNLFIKMLGLGLMLISLPLSRISLETYNNLMNHCDYSEQTHRMYEYSQVLQTVRRQPDCFDRDTVEDCQGYESAHPYTSLLKDMERSYKCSGFCYRPLPSHASAPAPAAEAEESLLVLREDVKPKAHRPSKAGELLALHTEAAETRPNEYDPNSAFPPTLFSKDNWENSCEGMAARDIRNFAGDIGYQLFYQGILLIFMAVTLSFMKLIGFCLRDDNRKVFEDDPF